MSLGELPDWRLGQDLDMVGQDLDMVRRDLDAVELNLDAGPDLDLHAGPDLDLDVVVRLFLVVGDMGKGFIWFPGM